VTVATCIGPASGDSAATEQPHLTPKQAGWDLVACLAFLIDVLGHENLNTRRDWIWHLTWVQSKQSIYLLEMSRREVASSPLFTRLHHRHARVTRKHAFDNGEQQGMPLGSKNHDRFLEPKGAGAETPYSLAKGQAPVATPTKHQSMKDARPRLTDHINVRVTADEYAEVRARAKAANVEWSVFVRSLLLDPSKQQRARRKTPDTVALGQALASLNKVGGLLNQIAKQANLVGDLSSFREAQEDRARLAEAVRAVIAALGELGR